jgi:hypothetical protein
MYDVEDDLLRFNRTATGIATFKDFDSCDSLDDDDDNTGDGVGVGIVLTDSGMYALLTDGADFTELFYDVSCTTK